MRQKQDASLVHPENLQQMELFVKLVRREHIVNNPQVVAHLVVTMVHIVKHPQVNVRTVQKDIIAERPTENFYAQRVFIAHANHI